MFSSLRRMMSHLRPYWKRFTLGQSAMVVAAACGLAYPWSVGRIFDSILVGSDLNILIRATGALAFFFVTKQIALYVQSISLGSVGERIVRDLRGAYYERVMHLSLTAYHSRPAGEFSSHLTNDIHVVQQGISASLARALQQILTLIVVTVMLLRIDATLALIVFAIIPVIMFISRRMGGRVRRLSGSAQAQLSYLMSIATQSISGIGVIKSFVLEREATRLFKDQNNRVLQHTMVDLRSRAQTSLWVGLIDSAFVLATLGIGAYRVSTGAMTPADLVTFVLYTEMIVGPLAGLSSIYVETSRALASFQRIAQVINSPTEPPYRESTTRQTIEGAVEYQGLGFAYQDGQPVLENVNLAAQPGQSIALVGPSGAGKSTLVQLLTRFYDATSGRLLIDGQDIRDYDIPNLREQIAIVPQETYLFDMSIRDNILCGDPNANQEDVERAARLANAHGFISDLAQGYDTLAGEGGSRLSGGQRQRIAIARAFLKNPSILILDEATSALDTRSEAAVQSALQMLMTGRTTFIIAHRLSTIINADRIAVLDKGQVVAVGDHHSLLERCALYQSLYNQQLAIADA